MHQFLFVTRMPESMPVPCLTLMETQPYAKVKAGEVGQQVKSEVKADKETMPVPVSTPLPLPPACHACPAVLNREGRGEREDGSTDDGERGGERQAQKALGQRHRQEAGVCNKVCVGAKACRYRWCGSGGVARGRKLPGGRQMCRRKR